MRSFPSSNEISRSWRNTSSANAVCAADNFEKLEAGLNEYLSENYTPADFEHTVYINGYLTECYSERFAKELEKLEPYGVGNRRPTFVLEQGASETRLVKLASQHVCVKSDKIELMYFGGAKQTYLLESRAPKSYVFEYNVSKFRGRDYVKGFVRDVITPRDAGAHCAEEIAVNNLLALAAPKADCEIISKTRAEIDEIMSAGASYGTLYIATDYSTLLKYKNAARFSAELFMPSSGNLADVILVSPRRDCDLSGFKRIIFLDGQPSGVRYRIDGKTTAIMCEDICGCKYLSSLSSERDDLLKIFSAVLAKYGAAEGTDSGFVALELDVCSSAAQTAFALEVFRQLRLISFEEGKLRIYRGVKTDLTNSELYNIVKNYENRTR